MFSIHQYIYLNNLHTYETVKGNGQTRRSDDTLKRDGLERQSDATFSPDSDRSRTGTVSRAAAHAYLLV